MSRTLPLLPLWSTLGAALLFSHPTDVSLADENQTTETPYTLSQPGPRTDASAPPAAHRIPRWLEEVRAQRQALQEQRRAQHEARRRAIDPLGAAQQEAREDAFLRRRQERRDMIEQGRHSFLNQGPWATPWPSPPEGAPAAELGDPPTTAPRNTLPDWDNGWYFRGW